MAVVRGQARFDGDGDLAFRARERPNRTGWSEVEQPVLREVGRMLWLAVDRHILRGCDDKPVERTQAHVEHIVVARRQHAHHDVETLFNRIYGPIDDDNVQRDILVRVLKTRQHSGEKHCSQSGGHLDTQRSFEVVRIARDAADRVGNVMNDAFGNGQQTSSLIVKWDDVMAGRRSPDTIALGAWGVEWHDRVTYESSFDAPPGDGAYEIPLSCLMSIDTPNLFAAGRTADGDRRAGASLRVMGTSFATGQAAGVAAAYYAQSKRVDANQVRSCLREQGALIASSEI
jgi:FAD dependent oxidoreductase